MPPTRGAPHRGGEVTARCSGGQEKVIELDDSTPETTRRRSAGGARRRGAQDAGREKTAPWRSARRRSDIARPRDGITARSSPGDGERAGLDSAIASSAKAQAGRRQGARRLANDRVRERWKAGQQVSSIASRSRRRRGRAGRGGEEERRQDVAKSSRAEALMDQRRKAGEALRERRGMAGIAAEAREASRTSRVGSPPSPEDGRELARPEGLSHEQSKHRRETDEAAADNIGIGRRGGRRRARSDS